MLDLIRTYKNFPKKGINFKDLSPIYATSHAMSELIDDSFYCIRKQVCKYKNDDKEIVFFGIESRGFILGSVLSQNDYSAFVPIRKAGKLPGKTIKQKYSLEYGKDEIEVQKIDMRNKVAVIVDDVYATGGTMKAAIKLIEKLKPEQIIPLVIYDVGISERIEDMIVLIEDEQ